MLFCCAELVLAIEAKTFESKGFVKLDVDGNA